jgi:hypothetical protein
MSFPLRFIPAFEGDMIEEALKADGKNQLALIEENTALKSSSFRLF